MRLISHRGNIQGRIEDNENKPEYIDHALSLGYEVEVDIWLVDNKIYLGHDEPQYLIGIEWLEKRSSNLWIHCKNLEALSYLNSYRKKFNYFAHDKDMGVLTSHNYIWSTNVCDWGILVLPEVFNTEPDKKTLGVCSDIIEMYKQWK